MMKLAKLQSIRKKIILEQYDKCIINQVYLLYEKKIFGIKDLKIVKNADKRSNN